MVKEAVLVGSGSCLIGSGLGSKIDSYHNVIRFKDQIQYLAKYSSDVGLKATSVVGNGNAQSIRQFCALVQKPIWSQHDISKVVFTVHGKMTAKRIVRRTKSGKRLVTLIKRQGIPIQFWHVQKTRLLLRRLGIAAPKKPTSGLMAIHYLLRRYDKINLCGFDFLSGQNTSRHFYNKRGVGGRHNLATEANVIRSLAEKTQQIYIWR